MAFSSHIGTEIVGIVNVAPATVEDNLELELLSPDERSALVNHTGIRCRRVADKQTDIHQLFKRSIEELSSQLNWDLASVDVLVVVTQSPQMLIPSISNRLQGDLNFGPQTIAFDINSGCSGFVYGLNTVYSMLASMIGGSKRAILCCGDLSTHLIDENDKSVKPIFSDGVSAIAIEKKENDLEISSYFNLETFGSGQKAIEMLPGETMKLNGIDVFGYSIKHVPQNISRLLEIAEKTIDFPDAFVLHQANLLINDSIRKKLGVEAAKFHYSLTEYGNTASASIPFTLGLNYKKIERNSGWILLSGFGVGFSVASALVRFNPKVCSEVYDF